MKNNCNIRYLEYEGYNIVTISSLQGAEWMSVSIYLDDLNDHKQKELKKFIEFINKKV